MGSRVFLEGETTLITLSNLKDVGGFEFDVNDLNEEADIRTVMEQLDAYSESAEIDLTTDVRKFVVMDPEGIKGLSILSDSKEQNLALDDITLVNKSFDPVSEILQASNEGDLIYLRKEKGLSNWEFSIEETDCSLRLEYFDCTKKLNQYDLLSESYYDALCDTILPESLSCGEEKARIESFDIDPQIVYGELYRVILDNEAGEKILDRIDLPGFYFLDKTRGTDE